MAALLLSSAFPVFTDKNGNPLEDGYIYIGTQNLNPETNPITVYFDSAMTIPAAQPIRTIGGYPSRNGSPAQLYVSSSCSMIVRDKKRTFVFNSPVFTGSGASRSVVDNYASLIQITGIDNQSVSMLGYNQAGDGGANDFFYSASSTATHNGGTVIKPTAVSSAGRWLATNTSSILLEQWGCKGDNSADDAAQLNIIAPFAIANKIHLVGSIGKTYLLSSADVNLRNVSFDFTESNVSLSGGHKLLIGGDSRTVNVTQKLGIVTRSGGATSTPTVRVMGAKDQDIHIRVVDFLQLYADTTTGDTGPDYSIAYSTFYINKVDKLELTNNAATPNSATQWINENTFFIKRILELYINGTYSHNNNIFQSGTFEGASIINIDKGNSNTFHDIRLEGTPSVTFGSATWANKIFQSWESNQYIGMEYECKEVTITDNGEGNFVKKLAHTQHIRTPIVDINSTTCLTFSNVNGATNFERSPNFTTLRNVDVQRYGIDQFQRANNRMVFDCPLIGVFKGDSIQFQASHALFRPHVQLYDADKVLITNENVDPATYKYIRASSGFVWDGVNKYVHSTDVSEKFLTIKSSGVAYITFDIMSGGASAGLPFDYLSVILATYRHGSGVFARADRQVSCNAATPTTPIIGFASELGTQVAKTTVNGNWQCVFALDTTLSVAGNGTDITITVTTVTGITSGDVIGIQLDSGAAHWTTVNGAPVGNVVTLTVALPNNAESGSQVVVNRWV